MLHNPLCKFQMDFFSLVRIQPLLVQEKINKTIPSIDKNLKLINIVIAD